MARLIMIAVSVATPLWDILQARVILQNSLDWDVYRGAGSLGECPQFRRELHLKQAG